MPLQVHDLFNDPDFGRLSPDAQKLILQGVDPDFAALSPGAQQAVLAGSSTQTPPQQGGTLSNVISGVLEKFGLRGPGPIESIFGPPKGEGLASKALGVVDPAIQILSAFPVGVGRAARDITELGGAAVGKLTGLGPSTPTPTLLSNIAELGGMFLAPGGGVVPRFKPTPTRVQGPIVELPGSEMTQPTKRPFGVHDPTMVQSAPIAPPVLPGAAGQGMPLLQPGVLPSQVEASMSRAGMRGPGLLSATEQPLITGAPARIERGTSEIVDQFGHRIPTRPPQHIEPVDAMMPPNVGPQPGALPGRLTSAADVAAKRSGLPLTGKAPVVEPLDSSTFYAFPSIPVKPMTAVGGVAGAVAGGAVGDTPEDRARNAIIGLAAGAAAPSAIGRWNARMGRQLDWANRVDMEVRSAAPLISGKEVHKVKARLPGSPLVPPAVQDTVAAINDTLNVHNVPLGNIGLGTQRNIRRGLVSAEAPLTLHLAQAINKDPAIVPTLAAQLQARGRSLMDVAHLMVDSGRSPSDLLQRAKGLSRVLEQDMLNNPQAAKLLRSVIDERPQITPADAAGHAVLRGLNSWRGLLVAALDTALRNTGVQQARIGIEALELTIENAVASAASALPGSAGVLSANERRLSAGGRYFWEYVLGWASPAARAQTNKILDTFPAFRDKMLLLYSSDVAEQMSALGSGLARAKGGALHPLGPIAAQVDRVLGGVEAGVKGANIANRFQEVMTRKLDFRAWLNELLARRGINDLNNIPVSQIPVEDVAQAVTHSLRMTFAESPSIKAPGVMERTFANVLQSTGRNPITAAAIHVVAGEPFVRFMWNGGRFLSERPFTTTTPALRTAWHLLHPSEHKAIVRGDLQAVSRAATGWAALLAARQFVDSEYVGDGLLEVKTPLGSFKLNTLGPILPAYVWIAQFEKHWREGTLKARWPEFSREAAMLRHRADDLLLGADHFIKNAPAIIGDVAGEPSDAGALSEAVTPGRFIGETAAGAMQWFTTVQRLFAAYGKYIPELEAAAREEDIKRDTRGKTFGEALTNPMQARVPVFMRSLGLPTAAGLPPQTSALRTGNIPIETPPTVPGNVPMLGGFPLPSNVIGLKSVVPRTAAEREALKLGLTPREISGQPTSFPGADRLVRREVGQVAPNELADIMKMPGYQKLPWKIKAFVMDQALEALREPVRKEIRERIEAKAEGKEALTPEEREFFDAWLKTQFDPRLRDIIRERGGKVPR